MAYTKNKTAVCPVCGSDKITPWMGGEASVQYLCKACGYAGQLVLDRQLVA